MKKKPVQKEDNEDQHGPRKEVSVRLRMTDGDWVLLCPLALV